MKELVKIRQIISFLLLGALQFVGYYALFVLFSPKGDLYVAMFMLGPAMIVIWLWALFVMQPGDGVLRQILGIESAILLMPHYIYGFITAGVLPLVSDRQDWLGFVVIDGGMMTLTPILSYWRLRTRSPAKKSPDDSAYATH